MNGGFTTFLTFLQRSLNNNAKKSYTNFFLGLYIYFYSILESCIWAYIGFYYKGAHL